MESSNKIPKGQLDIDHKLDKDFTTLTSATLPLAGTEEIAIVQGGETKKVVVSDVAPTNKKYHRYEFFVQNIFVASTLWYALRRHVPNTLYNPLFVTGYYNSTSNVIEEVRTWGHPITYNQKITKIWINGETVNDTITVRFQYYENPPLGSGSLMSINNHTIHDVVIPQIFTYRSLVEHTPAPFTMSKGGYFTILLNNNNLNSDVRTMSIIIETEEV